MTQAKILLVEDLAVAQAAALAILENAPCEVELAETGAEAITKTANESYQLILLDIGLPDLDILTVVDAIREQQPEVAIVALTAYASDEVRKKCFEAGMDDFLEKPLTIENMKLVLKKFISVPVPA